MITIPIFDLSEVLLIGIKGVEHRLEPLLNEKQNAEQLKRDLTSFSIHI